MEIARYRFEDKKRTRKLRNFARVSAAEDLRPDLAISRLLLQESLETGNVGLSNLLLNTVGKLAHSQTTLKKANAEYLDRDSARRLVEGMCDVVMQVLQGRAIPNWETVIEEIADALTATVEKPSEEEIQ